MAENISWRIRKHVANHIPRADNYTQAEGIEPVDDFLVAMSSDVEDSSDNENNGEDESEQMSEGSSDSDSEESDANEDRSESGEGDENSIVDSFEEMMSVSEDEKGQLAEDPQGSTSASESKFVAHSSSRSRKNTSNLKDVKCEQSDVKSQRRIDNTNKKNSNNGNINIDKPSIEDEYRNDTSDEEDIRNTVGNIPMNWYDEYPHLGYDWDASKILKPNQGDELDNFLKRMEDPNFWRTVKDPQTGQDVVLSDADVDLIQRLQKGKIPDAEFEDYAPWIEWFSSQVMDMPLRKFPPHKRSFLPSKSEKEKISCMVHAIKMGWMKPKKPKEKDPKFYMLWETDDKADTMRRIYNHIPAPKRHLPGHAESYNPPPEYLFDEEEMKEWLKQEETPSKRKLHFVPQKFNSLREVPAYSRYIKERFLRCLDLYLCPRARRMRLTIEPEDLVPQLPSPKDLQPFPTVLSLIYKGHTDMIRSITIDPKGQYLASGSDDFTVKIWEIQTARCLHTIVVGGVVRSVAWSPNQALSLLAVAADRTVLLISPRVGDHLCLSKTDDLLREPPDPGDYIVPERVSSCVNWEQPNEEDWGKKGIRVILRHFKEVNQVTWHGRGDYFATVMPEGSHRSVLIHQLSKRRSQVPFNKSKGLVQCVLFHPVRPFFFVATQRNVRVYDLMKQELVKKLMSNSRWISSMAVHPGGDNILVGTYDRKVLWFDLDLSTKPYQTLRLHGTAIRGVAYHKRYPLFASGSDDRSVIVFHGMVYNDLLQNALIVPVKRLTNHKPHNDFGVFDVAFHPTQPWVFTSGADGTVCLYT